jgi:hypothetical protein
MAADKTYQWEADLWPWHRRVHVRPELRAFVVKAIGRRFGLNLWTELTLPWGGGRALPGGGVKLGRPGARCSLGTIIHEVAHHYDQDRFGGFGHRASFKKALHLVYAHADRAFLCKVLREAKMAATAKRAEQARAAERVMREAERREEAKAKRKTRAFKMEALRKRITKNERRVKRLMTLIKSARRSLAAYERAEALSTEQAQEVAP